MMMVRLHAIFRNLIYSLLPTVTGSGLHYVEDSMANGKQFIKVH